MIANRPRAPAPALLLALALALALFACAPRAAPAALPASTLLDDTHAPHAVRDYVAHARFTVIFFFSAGCPVQKAHDARIRALVARFRDRGVQFLGVDSEVGATPERDADEAKTRGYGFPVWTDHRATFADAAGAEYATFTMVVDEAGRVRYSGGLDSDRAKLHDDATLYLQDALDDLVAGREPRIAHGKTLGCALRKS